MSRPIGIAIVAIVAALCGQITFIQVGHAAGDADTAVVRDFEKRASAYMDLRKSIESNMPALKSTRSQEKVSHHEHELARVVREARKGAQAGDIFTPAITVEIRRLIDMAMQSGGKRIEASLRHAEPVQLRVRVNESYPADIPLQSTPPSLLTNLPHLPDQLQYRVAGRDLILLDVKANLVVDLIESALP